MLSLGLPRGSGRRADRGAPRAVWACYGVLGAVLLGYLVWLVVRRNDGFSVPVDGWLMDGVDIAGGLLCLLRAFSRRGQERTMVIVLASSLFAWGFGDIALTVQSLGGAAPPDPPSVPDIFYLAFYPLAYVAVLMFLRNEVRGLSLASWLDGIVASLGAGAVCAMFAFHRIAETAGGSTLSVATDLAYPVGDLLLLTLIVGGTHLLPRHRRAPWAMLAAGMALNVVGDTFNLFGSTSFGASKVAGVANGIAWPAAIVVMSMAVWVRPRRASPVVQRQVGSLLPAVAATAALGILVAGTVRHPGAVAVGLATTTLVVTGVRVGLTMWELRKLTEQRRMESITDSLTGLGNRRHLFQVLDDFFDRQRASALEDKRQLAFLFMDLNHFKEINDSFGHPAGDLLLEQLGARFMASLRPIDTPVRLGGDEFAVVLMDADATEAALVAQRLMDCLEEAFELGPLSASVSASIGVALAPNDATESAALFWCADVAMYRAKVAGKAVAFYDPVLDDDDQWSLVEDLRRGLDEGQLVLHYQPQLNLQSDRIVAVEALVRWLHPKLGLVPPLKFIPLAEEAGLMGRLSEWVIDEALRQCANWLALGDEVSVSVNISASNLLSSGFAGVVDDLLRRHAVPARLLVLEITETTVISDFDGSKVVIDDLLALGIEVSIDDFGAGFTSLAHLSGLSVRELKLDRAFITGLGAGGRERDLQLVRSTVELAHALGLRVVAEGIEDAPTLELLSNLGCDLAQGFFISRPKPANEVPFGRAAANISATGAALPG
jgi:diguanylate cyclase (GGDEF)-like protein